MKREMTRDKHSGAGLEARTRHDEHNALAQFTAMSWDDLSRYVYARAERELRFFRGVDPSDVRQDVLTTMLRRDFGRKFDPRGSFLQFLNGVIHNACMRALQKAVRDAKKNVVADLSVVRGREPDPLAEVARSEFRNAVDAAVRGLTPVLRDALPAVMEHAEGYRADATPVNSTNHVRELRLRRRLREELSPFDPSDN